MFRQIHTSIWREDWFIALSPNGKLVFFYLLSNDYILPTGFVPITTQAIADETAISEQAVQFAISEFGPKVLYFPGWGFWVRRYSHWQGKGPKWNIALQASFARLPSPVKAAFLKEYPNTLSPTPSDTLSNGVSDTPPDRVSNTGNRPAPALKGIKVLSNNTKATVTPPTPPPGLHNNDDGFGQICKVYEQEFGTVLTPHIGEEIKAIYADIPENMPAEAWPVWIVRAIHYAVEQNIRKWSYVKGTLKGWQADGWLWPPLHKKGSAKEKEKSSAKRERVKSGYMGMEND